MSQARQVSKGKAAYKLFLNFWRIHTAFDFFFFLAQFSRLEDLGHPHLLPPLQLCWVFSEGQQGTMVSPHPVQVSRGRATPSSQVSPCLLAGPGCK